MEHGAWGKALMRRSEKTNGKKLRAKGKEKKATA